MDAQMKATDSAEVQKPFNWRAFILWLLLVAMAYFLSYGPIMMMQEKGSISRKNQFVWKFYYPLFMAYLNTPLHKPLGMYLHLWDSKHIDKNGDGLFPKSKGGED
jgi:hypothetical protein